MRIAVGESLDRRGGGAEFVTIERFGRWPIEVGMAGERLDKGGPRRAGCGDRSCCVERQATTPVDEIVHQGARRPDVERHQLLAQDIGDIGHAAEIEHHHRPGHLGRKGLVVERHQRCAFTPCRNVGMTKAADCRYPKACRDHSGAAELSCEASLGPMKHGLAMQPDHVDLRALDRVVFHEGCDCIAMRLGDGGFDVGEGCELGVLWIGDDFEKSLSHERIVRVAAARSGQNE